MQFAADDKWQQLGRLCDIFRDMAQLELCLKRALHVIVTGPVCNLKPVSKAPVSGLKEFPDTGGLSMRDRSELPS